MKKTIIICSSVLLVLLVLVRLLLPIIYVRNSRKVFKGLMPLDESVYYGLYHSCYEISEEEWAVIEERIPKTYSVLYNEDAQDGCWMIKGLVRMSDEESRSIDIGYRRIRKSAVLLPQADYYEIIVRIPTETGYTVYCWFDLKDKGTK